MTDPRGVHSAHLDAATIAALVDRTLDPAARAAAEAHLAGCADCRDVWMETSDIVSDTEVGGWAAAPAAADAPAPRGRSRRWIYGGAGLAVAAALALVVFSPRMFDRGDRPELRELVEAVGTNRRTEARLTGGFQWGPAPAVTRSNRNESVPAAVILATAKLRLVAERDRDARSLAALGTAKLVSGEIDEGIDALEESLRLAGTNADVLCDLSAAYFERFRRHGDKGDVAKALEAAERALAIDSALREGLFNRALALQHLEQRQNAMAAWATYMAHETDATWQQEAEAHINALRSIREP